MTNDKYVDDYKELAFKFDTINAKLKEKDNDPEFNVEEMLKFIKDNSSVISIQPIKNSVRLYLGKYDYESIDEPNRVSTAIYELGTFIGSEFIEQLFISLGCGTKSEK